MLGVWCNGSILALGASSPSSNLGTPNMKKYKGVIIEESLANKKVLERLNVVSTKVEVCTEKHRTPWVKQWTLHEVEIDPEIVQQIALELSQNLDPDHSWYADFDNGSTHYIIYREKIFRVAMESGEEYDNAKRYGISLGIPAYQVDFHPLVEKWER